MKYCIFSKKEKTDQALNKEHIVLVKLYESDKAKTTYVLLKLEFLNENNINNLNVCNLL